jgi:hypothetical protein
MRTTQLPGGPKTGGCIAVIVALVALTALVDARQSTEQAKPTGFILGQVVDGDTGSGLPGVVVTLGSSDPLPTPGAGAQPVAELIEIGSGLVRGSGPQVLTSPDGRFLFRDVRAGRYRLTATSPAYASGAFGRSRPSGPDRLLEVRDGQAIGDVKIRLWRYAAIGGAIVDEAGEPVVGVMVRAFRRVIAGGQPRFGGSLSSATSDDRGFYRIAGLEPGTYAVGVLVNQRTTPVSAVDAYTALSQSGKVNSSDMYRTLSSSAGDFPSSSAGFRIGDYILREGVTMARPAPSAARLMTYATQFHGGGSAPSRSSLVTVKSGEDRQAVDLPLQLVPAVRVSGSVSGPAGRVPYVAMTLVSPTGAELTSEGTAEAASTITDGEGKFTFLAVPSGSYVLKVRLYARPAAQARGAPPPPPPGSDATLWALHPISVGDRNVDDLQVVVRPGLKVTGRVEFAGAKPLPNADQISRMAITLQSAEGRTSAPIAASGRVISDGSFRTAGYPAGRYIVAATAPPGWHLASIVAGGRDVSVEPIELSDRDTDNVVITFIDQSTQLTGIVEKTTADHGAEAIAWPADSTAWRDIGVPARRWRNERPDASGAFMMNGLPPGEYFVAAVEGALTEDLRDPKILESLRAGATRVTLGRGGNASVRLQRVKLATEGVRR